MLNTASDASQTYVNARRKAGVTQNQLFLIGGIVFCVGIAAGGLAISGLLPNSAFPVAEATVIIALFAGMMIVSSGRFLLSRDYRSGPGKPPNFPLEGYASGGPPETVSLLDGQALLHSARLRGVIPFVVLWIPNPPFKFMKPTWRHLLLMDDQVVVVPAPGPPPTTSIASQLDQVQLPNTLEPAEVFLIRYMNVTRVRLHGMKHYTPVPRVTFWSRGMYAVDFQFIYPKGRSNLPDKEKIPYARDLFLKVLPSGLKVLGA